MTAGVRLYDASAIDTVAWPQTVHGVHAKAYLVPMVKEGPGRFIDNAPVRMLALEVGGEVVPLVLADGGPGLTNVCSPVAHYVDYGREELSGDRRASARVARALLTPLDLVMRGCRAGRIAYVNNWLWSTNPAAALTRDEIRGVTASLAREYPDRAIVFRSLNEALNGPQLAALREAGYRGVASRRIYLIDGADPASLSKRDNRRDGELLDCMRHRLVSGAFTPEDYARMIALYRALYLGKYPRLNVQFTADWLRVMVEGGLLTLHAFRRDGRIEAFWADFERDGVMTPPMIGYDLDAPRGEGLYRMAIASMIREAARRGCMLNLSSGVGLFKRNRGGRSTVEFDMVYARHLGARRRFPWWVLRRSFTAKRMEAMGD